MNVAEDVPRIGGTGRLPRTQCINNTQADGGAGGGGRGEARGGGW